MNSKLEKLALRVQRLESPFKEWAPSNGAIVRGAEAEREDRLDGNFPYDDASTPGITDFYAGKDIFITGGTGFVGKVLIEKTLRSLPEGGRIFLLLRGRKGLTAQQRVQAMLGLPLFKVVMAENPEASRRLVAIEGDCGSLRLGLSASDRRALIDNVSVVFHCAASVRFDATTNHLILVNTRGTREVVHLCKEFSKLESFVYVSTAFCNATKDRQTPIPEKIIRQDTDWRTAIAIAEKTEQDPAAKTVLDVIFEKLTTKHQNNYTFTKALAEDVVEDEAKDLPVIIVRPTMVIATYEDPFGGWLDNLYGPMSIWDGIGRGVIRTHYGHEHVALDYLPVDLCVRVLLAAGWHRGMGFRTRSDAGKVDVINNGFGDISLHTYGKIHEKMQEVFDRITHRFIFRYPRVLITDRFWAFWLITVFSHIPLGILADTALRLKGKRPQLLSIYRRLYFTQTKLLHFFSSTSFHFDLNWQWRLQARITRQQDRDRFSMIVKFYPKAFNVDMITGMVKYVFKEKVVPLEQSNRKLMHYLDWVHNAFLALLCWWVVSWAFFSQSVTTRYAV